MHVKRRVRFTIAVTALLSLAAMLGIAAGFAVPIHAPRHSPVFAEAGKGPPSALVQLQARLEKSEREKRTGIRLQDIEHGWLIGKTAQWLRTASVSTLEGVLPQPTDME